MRIISKKKRCQQSHARKRFEQRAGLNFGRKRNKEFVSFSTKIIKQL